MRKTQYTEKVVVPLTEWQREQLEKAARERGVSLAKLTRAALGQFLQKKSVSSLRQ